MPDIYPLQEIVETHGDVLARNVADNLHDKIVQQIESIYPEFIIEMDYSPEDTTDIIQPALTWKVMEKLAAQLQTSAEGWCEVYYRALKRRYEGEE